MYAKCNKGSLWEMVLQCSTNCNGNCYAENKVKMFRHEIQKKGGGE